MSRAPETEVWCGPRERSSHLVLREGKPARGDVHVAINQRHVYVKQHRG